MKLREFPVKILIWIIIFHLTFCLGSRTQIQKPTEISRDNRWTLIKGYGDTEYEAAQKVEKKAKKKFNLFTNDSTAFISEETKCRQETEMPMHHKKLQCPPSDHCLNLPKALAEHSVYWSCVIKLETIEPKKEVENQETKSNKEDKAL